MARPGRLSLQTQILILALLLWAIVPQAELWTLLAAYGAAWLIAQLTRGRTLELEGPSRLWLTVLAVAIPVALIWRLGPDIEDAEGWVGLDQQIRDRLRLEQDPAIAPPLLVTDRPQTFYVKASGARELSLTLGEGGPELATARIGEGLFIAGYDPRRDGLPAGTTEALDVAVQADGHIHKRRIRRVDPEPHPRWFCSHPESGIAATPSEETDEVIVLRRDGEMQRVVTGDGPSDCAFVELDGRLSLAVAHRYDDSVLFFDPSRLEERGGWRVGAFQTRLAVDPQSTRLAVALDGAEPRIVVAHLDQPAETTATGDLELASETIALEVRPDWLAFGRNGDELAVSSSLERTVCRFRRAKGERVSDDEREPADQSGWSEDAHLWIGRPAVTLAPSVDGDRLFIAVTDYRPDGEDHRGNHFIQDQILTLDVETWQITAQAVTGRRTPRQHYPGGLDAGTSPMGLMHRQDGTLLIAFAGSDELWQVDEELKLPPRIFRVDLVAPHGVADLGAGVWAASSPAGGAVAILDGDGLRSFLGVARKDNDLASAEVGSLDHQALTLRRGERAFYETTRSGISCQSCHLHSSTDSSPHDIGQQPLLPTLTVRGVTGTSPYLRDGSFPRVRDLHPGLAQSLLRGYRRYSESRPQDLESFVESLPRLLDPEHLRFVRDPDSDIAARLAEGFALFERAACLSCHPPPAFTHLGSHPVRTLFPDYGAPLAATVFLDTPSLLSIGQKDHWLQDGRASSLEAVLVEHNRANLHGDTADLEEHEIETLADFLSLL